MQNIQGWDGLGSVVAVYDQITVNKGEKYEFETLLLGKLETKQFWLPSNFQLQIKPLKWNLFNWNHVLIAKYNI